MLGRQLVLLGRRLVMLELRHRVMLGRLQLQMLGRLQLQILGLLLHRPGNFVLRQIDSVFARRLGALVPFVVLVLVV